MDLVLTSIDGAVGTITLNRPEKRNALSAEMVVAINDALLVMANSDAVRVVVLRGSGSAFCAGADLAYLQQISQNSSMENLADSMALMQMYQNICLLPKPVIAMVHGPAIAGGAGLATVCDVVVAGRDKGIFGYSEVKIGFVPAIVMVYLLRKIGDTQARKLVLSAENISAEEAHRIGMISTVADDDSLEQVTTEIAQRMAKNSASSMALSKHMLNALPGMSIDAGLQYAATMNAFTRQTEDCKNGIASFLDKQN